VQNTSLYLIQVEFSRFKERWWSSGLNTSILGSNSSHKKDLQYLVLVESAQFFANNPQATVGGHQHGKIVNLIWRRAMSQHGNSGRSSPKDPLTNHF